MFHRGIKLREELLRFTGSSTVSLCCDEPPPPFPSTRRNEQDGPSDVIMMWSFFFFFSESYGLWWIATGLCWPAYDVNNKRRCAPFKLKGPAAARCIGTGCTTGMWSMSTMIIISFCSVEPERRERDGQRHTDSLLGDAQSSLNHRRAFIVYEQYKRSLPTDNKMLLWGNAVRCSLRQHQSNLTRSSGIVVIACVCVSRSHRVVSFSVISNPTSA